MPVLFGLDSLRSKQASMRVCSQINIFAETY